MCKHTASYHVFYYFYQFSQHWRCHGIEGYMSIPLFPMLDTWEIQNRYEVSTRGSNMHPHKQLAYLQFCCVATVVLATSTGPYLRNVSNNVWQYQHQWSNLGFTCRFFPLTRIKAIQILQKYICHRKSRLKVERCRRKEHFDAKAYLFLPLLLRNSRDWKLKDLQETFSQIQEFTAHKENTGLHRIASRPAIINQTKTTTHVNALRTSGWSPTSRAFC